MGTANDLSSFFYAMTDYLATRSADRWVPPSESHIRSYRKYDFPSRNDFEGFIVIVSADLTFSHINASLVSVYGLKADVLSISCQ